MARGLHGLCGQPGAAPAWSEDLAEDEYPQLPTGFHGQNFTAFIKNHVGKTRPSSELQPPMPRLFPPASSSGVTDVDADAPESAYRGDHICQRTPPPGPVPQPLA